MKNSILLTFTLFCFLFLTESCKKESIEVANQVGIWSLEAFSETILGDSILSQGSRSGILTLTSDGSGTFESFQKQQKVYWNLLENRKKIAIFIIYDGFYATDLLDIITDEPTKQVWYAERTLIDINGQKYRITDKWSLGKKL